jgi:hypothetical protein
MQPFTPRPETDRLQLREPLGLQTPWTRDFHNLSFEWRRLFAEVLGTFFLVLVAADTHQSRRQDDLRGTSAQISLR